jgi:hypothetical protein
MVSPFAQVRVSATYPLSIFTGTVLPFTFRTANCELLSVKR